MPAVVLNSGTRYSLKWPKCKYFFSDTSCCLLMVLCKYLLLVLALRRYLLLGFFPQWKLESVSATFSSEVCPCSCCCLKATYQNLWISRRTLKPNCFKCGQFFLVIQAMNLMKQANWQTNVWFKRVFVNFKLRAILFPSWTLRIRRNEYVHEI